MFQNRYYFSYPLLSLFITAGLFQVTLPALAPVVAQADVQKVLFVCVKGRTREICPQFRTSLRVPEGWAEDKIAGSKQGRVVWVPKGKTFETAPYAISAVTLPNKAKVANDVSLQKDNDAFKAKYSDGTVAPQAPVVNAKLGGPVKVFKLNATNRKPRPFALVAKFADRDADGADYLVELMLEAPTDKAIAEARPKFDGMIKSF